MFAAGVLAGLNDISIILPVVLSSGTALAGWLFWRVSAKVLEDIQEALDNEGISLALATGLVQGELTEEQMQQLCDWTDKEAAKNHQSEWA
jgi:hypothetical protein